MSCPERRVQGNGSDCFHPDREDEQLDLSSDLAQWIESLRKKGLLQRPGGRRNLRSESGGAAVSLPLQVWLTLADQYLHSISIDWEKTLRFAFNERSNPDDDSLGIQIVKVIAVYLEVGGWGWDEVFESEPGSFNLISQTSSANMRSNYH